MLLIAISDRDRNQARYTGFSLRYKNIIGLFNSVYS